MTTAFDPIDLAGRQLPNRIVTAPMTRSRAYGQGASPTELMATYYAQRASAGLIVTEGTQPSPVGQGYPNTPGLHSPEQVTAWRQVTDAVHAAGGTIFAQLMHSGRIGHPSILPDGLTLVGPSPIAAHGQSFTPTGLQDYVTPTELTEQGIADTIADFAHAARNAVDAGFDGVEIHGANGYLVHQFLSTNANQRTDGWGGSVDGRVRFAVEVTRAVADAIEPLGLAYLHVMEMGPNADRDLTLDLRKRFTGTFILNPATTVVVTGQERLSLVEDGTADMISFGALFLANPDLPARLAAGGPFNQPDPATFYGGDEPGYTDYPRLAD